MNIVTRPKYKNLSEEIFWTCKGFNKNYEKESEIIKSHKMNIGDIVYVGSSNDSRPEYGWGIVFDNNGHYLSGENDGSDLLINIMSTTDNHLTKNHVKLKKYIQKHNIKYENIFRDIMNSDLDFTWFDLDYYGTDEFDSIVNNYKKYNLW